MKHLWISSWSLSTRAGWGALSALGLLSLGCGGQDDTYMVTPGELVTAAPEAREAEDVASEVLPSTAAGGAPIQSEHIQTMGAADGSFSSEINATDTGSWVYFSLRDNAEVSPEVPEQSPAWDLGFQRSNVKVNGGVSGAGGVTVAVATGSFESVTAAPEDGYVADVADDVDGSPDYAFGAGDGWYSYDPASHQLTARETVFVVQTEGRHFKLQFSSYYDAAGTPGVLRLRWAPL